MTKRQKEILITVVTVLLFILTSYFSKKYAPELQNLGVLKSTFGVVVYILIMMLAVIIAPAETLPLMPVAVNIWGPNPTAIFSIIGWTIGSLISFGIARVFGERIVCYFAPKSDITKWKNLIPEKNAFWLVAFARIVLPVDIVSYAVGLFTNMTWPTYLLATVIGITPFAFVFSHGAKLPLFFQALAGSIILVLVIFSYKNIKKQIKVWAE